MSEKLFITGGDGQLGSALAKKYPMATVKNREAFDITDPDHIDAVDWSAYDVIINGAAFVNADGSETQPGLEKAWRVNAEGPRNLARVALRNGLHFIHFSSEYVFDGTKRSHQEDEPFSPLSVYGQSKAAGDIAVSLVPEHHILRTTWVVGEGHNFVKTIKTVGDLRTDPTVVNDQFGRLTFTSELVRAVDHILENSIEPGTYNLSNSGEIRSWADIAALAFKYAGHDSARVIPVSTEEYAKTRRVFAARPVHSDLDLSKIQRTGFVSLDYLPLLEQYVKSLETIR